MQLYININPSSCLLFFPSLYIYVLHVIANNIFVLSVPPVNQFQKARSPCDSDIGYIYINTFHLDKSYTQVWSTRVPLRFYLHGLFSHVSSTCVFYTGFTHTCFWHKYHLHVSLAHVLSGRVHYTRVINTCSLNAFHLHDFLTQTPSTCVPYTRFIWMCPLYMFYLNVSLIHVLSTRRSNVRSIYMCSLHMFYLNVCPLHTCHQHLFLTHVSSTRVPYKGLTYTWPSHMFHQHVSLIKV